MTASAKSFIAIDSLKPRQFIHYASLLISSSMITACTNQNQKLSGILRLDKVSFGTNWIAQAEHGGFYQGIATEIYKDHGLDVTIKMGSPQVASGTQLLMGVQ